METEDGPNSMPIPTKMSSTNNDNNNAVNNPSPSDNKNLSPCLLCGRKFLNDRIVKHLEICKKLKEKKRKQFDSTKQRFDNNENNDIKPMISRNFDKNKTDNNKNNNDNNNNMKKKSNWRQQHEEFIKAIRNARGESMDKGGTVESNNNDDNMIPYGMTECPTCLRRFSDKSADRHIQWCREKAQNDNKRKQSASNQEAMERMKARTKYKPTVQQSSRPTSKSISPRRSQAEAPTTNNNRRQTSNETNSSRANSTNSRQSVATTTTSTGRQTTIKNGAATTSGRNNSNNNRLVQKSLSKSTGNLSRSLSRSTNNSSRMSNVYNNNGISNNTNRLDRGKASNQTISLRKNPKSSVQAKVNTGLYGSNGTLSKNEKSSAPIMKFKEKFPNHQHQRNNTIDYDILRKNSTYDDSPKTVPGVRTGGISPTKSESRMSKSEFASNQIDNIKKRIDMYISGIYDNDLLQRFGNTKQQPVEEYDGRGTVNIERSASAHSVLSARGSTSDSSDSGLGSHLQAQDKDNKRTEIFSPSMSELEGNIKLDLRNGSLNDIHHLLEQKEDEETNATQTQDLTPRFCHTCGTKYPNALAKFCYECGSKRFPAAFQ